MTAKKATSVRLDATTLGKLQAHAGAHDCTVGEVIRLAIERLLSTVNLSCEHCGQPLWSFEKYESLVLDLTEGASNEE